MPEHQYVITKRIAKQGRHHLLIIPTSLHEKLKPRMLVKATIDVVEGGQ